MTVRNRRQRLVTTAVLAVIMAGLSLLSTCMPASATVPVNSDPAVTQVKITSIHLSPKQAEALRRAAEAHPGLTRAEARQMVSSDTQLMADAEGSGESRGPCGVATLWGDTTGHYRFGLRFNTEVVGTAAMGGVTASTNGMYADRQDFGVSGSYVGNDQPGDYWYTLSTIGWGATATTLNGWALTNGAWWCGIDVIAYWQW